MLSDEFDYGLKIPRKYVSFYRTDFPFIFYLLVRTGPVTRISFELILGYGEVRVQV